MAVNSGLEELRSDASGRNPGATDVTDEAPGLTTSNKVRYERGSWHRYWEQGRY